MSLTRRQGRSGHRGCRGTSRELSAPRPRAATDQKQIVRGGRWPRPERTEAPAPHGRLDEMLRFVCAMEYHAAVRRDEVLTFATTWMGLEILMLSKTVQAVKVANHVISLTCGL